MKKNLMLFTSSLAFLILFLFSKCDDNDANPSDISLTIKVPIEQLDDLLLPEVLITNGDTTFSKEMDVSNGFATATFNNLVVGEWTYSVKMNLAYPDFFFGDNNEFSYSYDEACSNPIDYLTWRKVDQVLLTGSKTELLDEPSETNWQLYYAERSISGDYIFLPMMNAGFLSNQSSDKLFKLFIELAHNPGEAPSRPDLNLYGVQGHHSWNFFYELKIYSAEAVIFDKSIQLFHCGDQMENCQGSIGEKQRLIEVQFNSSDFIELPEESWTYWTKVSISRQTSPGIAQFAISKNLILEKSGIDDIGFDPYPCAILKSF